MHPIIPYHKAYSHTSKLIQSLSVWVNSIVITIIYINHQTSWTETANTLEDIDRVAGSRAVTMGDMNAWSKKWDIPNNTTGIRLQRWATGKGCTSKGPHTPSCKTKKGRSAPEIFLTKALKSSNAKFMTNRPLYSTDDLPVQLMVDLRRQEPGNRKEEGMWVPRRQRNNKKILDNAKTHLSSKHPSCVEVMDRAQDPDQLEAAYELYKQTLLYPWAHTKKRKPGRFKGFWNDKLDALAKKRKALYRRAPTTDTAIARSAFIDMDKRIKNVVKENKRKQLDQVIKTW